MWGVGARFEAIMEPGAPIEAFEHSFGMDAKNGMYWLKRRYWRKGMARELCACLERQARTLTWTWMSSGMSMVHSGTITAAM